MRSDAELMRRARTDAAPFRVLYERHAGRIFAYHHRRCGDIHTAQDLTAETFARAWLVRGRFRDLASGSAGPWLFGIARNVLRESVRRQSLERRACVRLGLQEHLDLGPSAVAPSEAWLDGADDFLAVLPPAQRDAVRMYVLEDLTYDETAARLGTTSQAVRARVSRGLRAIRLRSQPDGGSR